MEKLKNTTAVAIAEYQNIIANVFVIQVTCNAMKFKSVDLKRSTQREGQMLNLYKNQDF